ncbi:MAG TPA: DUF4097 family beta strand repeat-containing protein [Candidatus Acidoferrum sp.]|nr:DUF4097 family beta strand repeat-containing protein [Candidatus Acidoferrum sp.]
MRTHKLVLRGIILFAAAISLFTLQASATDNTFDRSFTVSGPVRLELSNGSGNVAIRGTGDGKVHVHGRVTKGWTLWGNSETNVQEAVSNPPLEQRGNTILIGKETSWLKYVAIDYQIEVPRDTEIDASVASGGVTIDQVRGPVKCSSASGYVHVYRVERETQLSAASGSIEVSGLGGVLRVSTASGSVNISDVKGDIQATAVSGSIHVANPGGRVEASNVSGSINVTGANNDVRAHVISGPIEVTGNPSSNRYWDLKTVSGSVEIRVPPNSSFLLSADATSGDIRTNLPVMIEEQSKHAIRAHVGNSTGRVEVHTVSGGINVQSGS